jgi:hypothetical protein
VTWSQLGDAATKLGALSGFASLAWQIVKDRQAARRRPEIVTTRREPEGLVVEVRFRPRDAHSGLKTTVTLVEPADATVVCGKPNPAGGDPHFVADGVSIGGGATVKMRRRPKPDDEAFEGAVFLYRAHGRLGSAKLKVDVLTDPGGVRLGATTVTVSAID